MGLSFECSALHGKNNAILDVERGDGAFVPFIFPWFQYLLTNRNNLLTIRNNNSVLPQTAWRSRGSLVAVNGDKRGRFQSTTALGEAWLVLFLCCYSLPQFRLSLVLFWYVLVCFVLFWLFVWSQIWIVSRIILHTALVYS